MKLRVLVVFMALATSACTTTAAPAPPAPLSSLAWSRVSHDAAAFGAPGTQSMQSVTAGGPGLVAVGWDDSGGDPVAVVWTSGDGISWSRVPHVEAVFGGQGGQSMNSVTAGGPGLVAVGYDWSGGDWDAAVWTSPDGISWSRVPHDDAAFDAPGTQEMNSVTAGGPGLVAVGQDWSGGDDDAAVWTSGDGISWSRVPHDEAVFGGEGTQSMRGVTAGGPGLVAVGWDDSSGDDDAVVWTSGDGISWSRVPHDEAVFGGQGGQSMNSVTAGGPGLVAVGSDGDFDAGVWTSGDGISWSRVPHDAAVFGGEGYQSMNSVTAGDPDLVAVGSGGNTDAGVWTSRDGISWSRVPHDEAVFGGEGYLWMKSVTAAGPDVVAVGEDESGGDYAGVWVATSDD